MIEAWTAGGQAPRDGGVYWQTLGPRFETPAEIRLIAAHADVVGMTIASECIVAGELGLDYAALCVVDNLANGLGEGELDVAAPRGRPPRQRGPPARRPGGGAAAARRGRRERMALCPRLQSAMALTVTGAVLDGETRRPALRGRADRGARAGGRGRARRRDDRRRRRAARRAAAQRPHARGDDAVPRQRRRPAADALAAKRRSGRSRRSSTPRTSTGARGWPAPR